MKRFLAMVLVLCVLFSMQPAFAYAESTPEKEEKTETRTVEEILDEYHRKSLEAAFSAEKNAGTSSRSATSGKTLEQETVDALTEAGYEAYNVTGDNYEALEKTLKTDFGSMGLDPNGSYIITISGDEENAPNNSNSRGRPEIGEVGGPGDDTGGSSIFMHTYNGTTYTMRYVTVTGTENSLLNVSSDADVLDECNASDIWDVLDGVVTISSTLGLFPEVCEFYSFYSALIPEAEDIRTESLIYMGGTNWTIKYIQIYNFQTSAWEFYASTEYVSMYYSWTHMYYDPSKNGYDSKTESGDYGKIYSEEYNNTTYMRDQAAFAYTNYGRWLDTIDYVTYEFKDRDIITHSRWVESFGYEPA